MPKTAIYPGTFDPITFGHIDVIKKSLKIVDKLIVATTDNIEKDYLFSLDERIEILNKSLFNDLRLSKNKIKIISFDDLTVKICKKYKASIIIRGLRAVSDFEYEFQLAGMNKKLDKSVETDVESQSDIPKKKCDKYNSFHVISIMVISWLFICILILCVIPLIVNKYNEKN